jgi:hypothetical protein
LHLRTGIGAAVEVAGKKRIALRKSMGGLSVSFLASYDQAGYSLVPFSRNHGRAAMSIAARQIHGLVSAPVGQTLLPDPSRRRRGMPAASSSALGS